MVECRVGRSALFNTFYLYFIEDLSDVLDGFIKETRQTPANIGLQNFPLFFSYLCIHIW